MPKNCSFFAYSGSYEEYYKLKKTVKHWNFWQFNQVENSLTKKNYKITYLTDLKKKSWLALSILYLSEDTTDLIYIHVAPKYRTKGLGFLLLKTNETYLRERKQKHLILEVRESALAAIKLYKKFKMGLIGKRKNYYKDGEDALIFKKDF